MSYVWRGDESLAELMAAYEAESGLDLNVPAFKVLLRSFLDGKIGGRELAEITEFLEMSEFASAHEATDTIKVALFLLANPDINFPNSREKVANVLRSFG